MNSRQACSVKMAGNWPFFFRDRPFNFRGGGGGGQKQKQKIHTQENYENKIRLQVPSTLGICTTGLLKTEISHFQSFSNNFVSVHENHDKCKKKKIIITRPISSHLDLAFGK